MNRIALFIPQKKTIKIILIPTAVFFFFFSLILAPVFKKWVSLKREFNQAQAGGIKGKNKWDSISGGDGLAMDAEFQRLIKPFENNEEGGIKEILALARESGVKINSVTPDADKPVFDINGSAVEIGGKKCRQARVSVEAISSYKSLAEYARFIEESRNVFMVIESLVISKSEQAAGKLLNVSIAFVLYLL